MHAWVADTPANRPVAERLWAAMKGPYSIERGVTAFRVNPDETPDAWAADHASAFAAGRRRSFVSATGLARLADDTGTATNDPGLAKEGRDLELPPWNKGRYGTAIGRAVHAVLQTVDRGPDGENVDAILQRLRELADMGFSVAHGRVVNVYDPKNLEIIGERIVPAVADW